MSSAVRDCTLPAYFSTGIPRAGSGVAPKTVTPGSTTTGELVSDCSGSVDGACAAAGERASRNSGIDRRIVDLNARPRRVAPLTVM
jgi:hypothetical protein